MRILFFYFCTLMEKKLLRFRFLAFLLSIYHLPSFAGGFQVNLQGQKQAGMGHTGTAVLQGASCAFFNPGALAFIDSASFMLGGHFIIPRVIYKEPYPGVYTTETIHRKGTPFSFYASYKPQKAKDLTVGMAVYTPFGSGIQYPDDWRGQFVLREMELRTIFFQPTVSYRITEKFGVGAGFIYGAGSFTLRKGIPVADQNGVYGEGVLSGNANGTGYNLGLYYDINSKIALGVSYRSPVKVSTNSGKAEFTVPSSLQEYFPNTSFSTTIQLPSVTNIGASYKLNDKSQFAFDVNFVGWSVYDTLSFDFVDNTDKLKDINSPRKYKDSYIIRLGYQHAFFNWFTLRGGTYYDVTPVPSQYVTPETPDTDKFGITTGFTLKTGNYSSLDFSLLFIEGKERTAINQETYFGGTWKSRAVVPGVSLNVAF